MASVAFSARPAAIRPRAAAQQGARRARAPAARPALASPAFSPSVSIRDVGSNQRGALAIVAATNEDGSLQGLPISAADELRRQERFMREVGTAECSSCRYSYDSAVGDPEYPVAKGTSFTELPEDWACPVCGAPKDKFVTKDKVVAGFEANQGYGLGTNSMTGGQKSGLIFGSLLLFFLFFISGYLLD